MSTRIQIDEDNRHFLELSSGADKACRLSLHHDRGDRRSALHDAIRQHLIIRTDGHDFRLDRGSDALHLPLGSTHFELLLDLKEPVRLSSWRLSDRAVQTCAPYRLSPFESRFLAENGFPHPVPPGAESPPGLLTDLHTHFAGCVSAEELIAIGIEIGATMPSAVLMEAGIRQAARADIKLEDLTPALRKRLEYQMEVPSDRRITFLDMEKIYRMRSPITKHPNAFVPLCRKIADDYRAMGVRYVELSLGNIVESETLAAVLRVFPDLERQTGVRIRFLAAMWRHSDLEWDLDYIARIKQLARCPA